MFAKLARHLLACCAVSLCWSSELLESRLLVDIGWPKGQINAVKIWNEPWTADRSPAGAPTTSASAR